MLDLSLERKNEARPNNAVFQFSVENDTKLVILIFGIEDYRI